MPKWAVIKAHLLHRYRLLLYWFESQLPPTCRKVRLIYLDQNALIGLGLRAQKDPLLRERLYKRIGDGSLAIVLSPWHLVETAQSTNINSATRLAEFMDSLKPLWIHERRELQKLDVQEDFYRFCKIEFQVTPRVTSKAAVIGALFGQAALAKYEIPARDFVKQWIEHPEQLGIMKKSFESNAESLLKLRELATQGKLTEGVKKKAAERFFELSMPKSTPTGLEIGADTAAQYVAQASTSSIPTFAVEEAISVNEWGKEAVGKVDRNTFVDKIHLISALPFVDEIVSTDPFFRAIYPAAQKCGHVRAALLGNEELMARL
jgi:hypothetical protein